MFCFGIFLASCTFVLETWMNCVARKCVISFKVGLKWCNITQTTVGLRNLQSSVFIKCSSDGCWNRFYTPRHFIRQWIFQLLSNTCGLWTDMCPDMRALPCEARRTQHRARTAVSLLRYTQCAWAVCYFDVKWVQQMAVSVRKASAVQQWDLQHCIVATL